MTTLTDAFALKRRAVTHVLAAELLIGVCAAIDAQHIEEFADGSRCYQDDPYVEALLSLAEARSVMVVDARVTAQARSDLNAFLSAQSHACTGCELPSALAPDDLVGCLTAFITAVES